MRKLKKHKNKFYKLSISLLLIITLLFLTVFPVSATSAYDLHNTTTTNTINIQQDNIAQFNTSSITLEKLPIHMKNILGLNKIEADQQPIALAQVDATELTSVTTVNKDGTHTLYLFDTPVKYVDNGSVKFIDNTIKKEDNISSKIDLSNTLLTPEADSLGYTNTANRFDVNMPSTINNGVSLTYKDTKFVITPSSLSTAAANLTTVNFLGTTDQVVEYQNVFGNGIHLQYMPINNGIKENIVLEEYTGVNTFDFIINTGDFYPLYNEGEAIPFADPTTDKITFILGQVDARDSYAGNETDGHFTLYNSLSVAKIKDGIYSLTVTVDPEFLTNENTVYPVIIDPSITISSSNMQDTSVYSGKPSSQTFYSSAYNIVGNHGASYGVGTAFIQTTGISNYSYIMPNDITNATYRVYEGSGKTNSVLIQVSRPQYVWDQSSITYNNMPNLYPVSFLTINNSGWKEFDITNLVKDWIAHQSGAVGAPENSGFALKAVDNAASSLHFCSSNHGSYTPSITITYSTAGTTFDLDAVYNAANDVPFKAFGYLIHGTSPEFKIKISTAGTYTIETLNSEAYFGVGFAMQDTRIELLNSSYGYVASNDNISSSNTYSSLTIYLTAGTYYLRVYNSSGTRTNIKCYVAMELANALRQDFSAYANMTRDFYQVSASNSSFNCLSYVLRDRSQWIGLPTNITDATNKLISYNCNIIPYPTDNCIVLYGYSNTSKHVSVVENGVVKSKLSEDDIVRHSTIEAYYKSDTSFGYALKYFSDPAAN